MEQEPLPCGESGVWRDTGRERGLVESPAAEAQSRTASHGLAPGWPGAKRTAVPFPLQGNWKGQGHRGSRGCWKCGENGRIVLWCGKELERPGSQVPARPSSWPPAYLHEKEFSKHNVGREAWGMDVHEGITPGKHPIVVEPSVPQAVGG